MIFARCAASPSGYGLTRMVQRVSQPEQRFESGGEISVWGERSMNRIRVVLATAVAIAAVLIFFTAPASAQYPNWGAYDEGHEWHDAGWWWANNPDWVRHNHPTWWGDFDQDRVWHPAAWWWDNNADWVRHHHPEWWGDWDDAHFWRPADWWWQNRASWVYRHHPEWWGAFYQGVWYPAGWWVTNFPQWVRLYHPDWWGAVYQDNWYPAR